MVTAEGVFPKIGGDPLYASEINSFGGKIKEVYTSTGIDTLQIGAGTAISEIELTVIPSAEINNTDYIKISITGTAVVSGEVGGHTVALKVYAKEIGGSYSDSTDYQTLITSISDASGVGSNSNTYTWIWVHTLTAGQKTNGVQIKLASRSIVSENGTGSPGNIASFTLFQAVESLT